MEIKLETYLQELRSLILRSAGHVEESIGWASEALQKRDKSYLSKVFDIEIQINQWHKEIDNKCFKILARQSPVATDLRLVLTITKMNLDLERMADLSCNMAHFTREYLEGTPLPIAEELPVMLEKVRTMIKQSLDAFSKKDPTLAKIVLVEDDDIDKRRDQVMQKAKETMKSNSSLVEESLALFMIARLIERMGDHATNLAEEAIFLITGEDIRHSQN